MAELGKLMRDRQLMAELRNNVWQQQHLFTFDYNADSLIQFFKAVINKRSKPRKKKSEAHLLPDTSINTSPL
jgi:hypothetical protein